MPATEQVRTSFPEDIVSQQLYWLSALSGSLPEANWLISHSRPSAEPVAFERRSFQLPDETAKTVLKMSRGSGLSSYLALAAAFKVLLYKYTGCGDVIVLSPSYQHESDRDSSNNLVPLRTAMTGASTFKAVLLRLRQTALEAYGNQDITLSEIAEVLRLPSTDGGLPISNIVISLENIHKKTEARYGDNDITISFLVRDETISGELTYNAALFSAPALDRLIAHFVMILSRVLRNIELPLSEISLLTDAEARRFDELNQTATLYSTDRSVADLFEEQAEKTPDRVAVVCNDESMTYRQLSARSNRVAHHLKAVGIGPESLVALLNDRGIGYLVAILGVFKAGGAYLPLDPAHPANRLGQVLDRSRSELVLVGDRHRRKLSDALESVERDGSPEVISVDEILQRQGPETRCSSPAEPNSLSYVFYTSGSTGIPKGAMIEQAGFRNHLFAKIEDLQLTGGDVLAQNASQCFDVSVWQFLAVLLVGGRVCIVDDESVRDANRLLNEVATKGITVLEIVPSQLRAMLEGLAIEPRRIIEQPTLRCLFVMGEVLPPELCRKWSDAYPGIPIVNAWGATETSDDVTHYAVADLPSLAASVPIGKPLGNTKIHLLDGAFSRVPLGIAGEIFAGGICVGRGYLHDAERTAAAFVPDPFADEPGARLYKTGDLASYLEDGNVDFIGRADHQVKVRGYRIELGEIEAALRGHPAVSDATVLAREETAGDKRLVAYVVTRPGPPLAISDLRAFVKERLPDYMTPAAIVMMEAIPLTPNGKVDRRALPPPDVDRPELEKGYVAPRTHSEQVLANVWSQVLGISTIGVHDNFFELGGDSILSIQVVAKARNEGIRIAPNQIFQHQTISELAAVAEAKPDLPLREGPVTGPAPLTPIQRWFFELKLSAPNFHNQALLLEASRHIDGELLKQTLRRLIEHHDALRLRFVRDEDGWHQFNAPVEEGDLEFSRVDLSSASAALQDEAISQTADELHMRMNLSTGPLVQAALFDLGSQRNSLLLIIIHHLAVDGVSWRILHEDIESAYEQLSQGKEVVLPNKTSSYKEWAERLVEYAQSAELPELDYWTYGHHRAGDGLLVDFPDGENSVASTASVSLSLEAEETRVLLRDVVKGHNVHINDILLAALLQTCCEWSGGSSVRVDIETHGRASLWEDLDLTRTVGWFTSIYPVLLDRGSSRRPDQLLRSVSKQLREVPQQGIGYGVLRYLSEDAEVVGRLEALPRSEIIFNYLGQFDQDAEASPKPNLTWKSLSLASDVDRDRGYSLEMNGLVSGGRLQISFSYSENLYRRSTILGLAHAYIEALRSFMPGSSPSVPDRFSPSDFPDANLTQARLDKLIAFLDQTGESYEQA